MEPYQRLKDRTAKADAFVDVFQGKLEELLNTSELYPSVGIAVVSNLNFHDQDIPASLFNRLDFSKKFDNPEDPVVLGEMMKRINVKDSKIKIDRTIREIVGEFRLQYNFIRGFRPKREAKRTDVPLDLPFREKNEKGEKIFNYADENECDPEVFMSTAYSCSLQVDFMLNRYPFAPYHFLWIPNRKKGRHNQFLDPEKDSEIIESFWNLVANGGYGEGMRLAYNSNGAHASVNHLHLQGFFLLEDWQPPIEEKIRKHNEIYVDFDWPMKGARWLTKSDGVEGLKDFIKEMNDRYYKGEKLAYNFYITPKGAACFPRKHQGDDKYFALLQKANFTTGLAFFEMLGEIISTTADVSIFKRRGVESQMKELYDSLSLKK